MLQWIYGVFVVALCVLTPARSCRAADAVRIDRDINSHWKFLRSDAPGAQDPAFDDSAWESVNLPYTWLPEVVDGRAKYYAGHVWYRRHLAIGPDLQARRLYLRFGAGSRVTEVYVNGDIAGTHRGAFAAFCFDVTTMVHPGDNVIAVDANNASNKDISPISGDFTIYGGLYRGVHLLALNPISVSPLDDAGPGVYLKTEVSDDSATVQVTTKLQNATDAAADVTVDSTITDASGRSVASTTVHQEIPGRAGVDAVGKLTIARPHLWNGRGDPYLYRAIVEVRRGDEVLDRVIQPLGLRYFRVDPDLGLFLNGKPYDFHGVDYHEGRPSVGFADTPAMEEEDNRLIVDMGATGVRMAHYQHNDYEYTLCDRSGLIVWTELALVNRMTDTPAFRDNVKQQLRELIKQEFNHPSVFFWSMYNEPWVSAQAGTQEQWRLIGDLVSLAHQLDPTRLTTGAAVDGVKGPINWYMDVTGKNRYDGWYGGSPEDWPKTMAAMRAKNPGRSLGISEYGAGASVFQHENNPAHPVPGSKWHPEEWQAIVHEHAWASLERQPWLWCKIAWCMFDFSSIGRHEGDTTGINDKGLVSADRKTCKDAYFFYKACWTSDPFVYITDRRFNPRPPGDSDLKVYSNCDSVELKVDGRSLGVRTAADHIFLWRDVKLPAGGVHVEAAGRAGGKTFVDTLQWTVSPDAKKKE